jgi:murein DD-endopeptidase MepM/ murein hydrolase activator NlpD
VKRKFVLTLALVIAAVLVTQPYQGKAATQLDKINKQIKDLQNEMNRKAQMKRNAENNVKNLTGKKQATKEEIQAIMSQIDKVGNSLMQTENKISDTEQQLQQTGLELEEAVKREQETGSQLDSRLQVMYKNGAVSYVDVLLSSTSFGDFLTRFDAMESITVQTRDVLDEKKAARLLVAQKQQEVAKDLKQVKALYEQMAGQKADLEDKENAKEQMVAQISAQIVESEDISAESEKQLMDLAQKMAKLQEAKNRAKNYYKGGKLAVPLHTAYRMSSPFGYRIHPITGAKKLHSGMDMAAPQGTPIYAAESGVVIVAQWWSGYGNCVIINHGGGLWTLYGHIKNGGILVQKGDTVKRGQKIALIGSTGNSTGPHLHFEVRKNSTPVNPAPYLR